MMEVTEHPGMDEFGFIGHVVRLVEEGYKGIKPTRINVDATGFGATIVKTLHEKGQRYQDVVRGFHMQQRSTYPEEYGNKRAECWGEMKKAITSQQDLFDLPDDEALMIELTCIHRKSDSAGRVMLEGKDSLKIRGYESPNKADAASYCFAEPLTFYTEQKIDYPMGLKSRVIA